jgi:hypothetical protein
MFRGRSVPKDLHYLRFWNKEMCKAYRFTILFTYLNSVTEYVAGHSG